MEYNSITQLEQELARVLKEEYSFYQSLYILIDKQRDLLKFEKEEKLLDIYTEIERCHERIRESEEKISMLRQSNPQRYRAGKEKRGIRVVTVRADQRRTEKTPAIEQDPPVYPGSRGFAAVRGQEKLNRSKDRKFHRR
jgi:hypothetical protein